MSKLNATMIKIVRDRWHKRTERGKTGNAPMFSTRAAHATLPVLSSADHRTCMCPQPWWPGVTLRYLIHLVRHVGLLASLLRRRGLLLILILLLIIILPSSTSYSLVYSKEIALTALVFSLCSFIGIHLVSFSSCYFFSILLSY